MIMIKLDPISTTSILSATTTTESSVDNEDDATTTALAVSSTLTTSMPSTYAHAEATQRYLDSLSDTQLIEMEQRLEQKANSLHLNVNGEEKIIEIKEQTGEEPKTYKKL